MAAILVTGGTGSLGRFVVTRLVADGHDVRCLSRRPEPAGARPFSWVTADLYAGDGVARAVRGVDAIVHCATMLGRKDVAVTRRLIDAASASGTPHLVYPSIVGCDQIPLGYYRTKAECERLIESSGLPWTILRATQFHSLFTRLVDALRRSPVLPIPSGWRSQPVAAAAVADRLAELVDVPHGRVADLGGPDTLEWTELIRQVLAARGQRRIVLPVPVVGRIARGFRAGRNLLGPDGEIRGGTFAEYLRDES
jgi:uncharacterized protein YbjT (DUF2867 family)